MQSATCNTFSSQDHAEAGFAKAGTAQFSHGQELFLAKHEVPGHMACREEFGPVKPFKSLNFNSSCQVPIQTGVLIKTPLAFSATVLW